MSSSDRGSWSVFSAPSGAAPDAPKRIGVISSDFTHDVVLYVNGDFADDESKLEYAQLIAERLNRTIPQ